MHSAIARAVEGACRPAIRHFDDQLQTARIAELENQLDKLRQELKAEQQKSNSLDKSERSLKAQCHSLDDRVLELQAQVAARNTRIKELTAALETSRLETTAANRKARERTPRGLLAYIAGLIRSFFVPT